MIFELNVASSSFNSGDCGLTPMQPYMCAIDKSMFKTYEDAPQGHVVVMDNHDTTKVDGKGFVDLQFTFGKKLVLTNVLHVLDMRKNLVSADRFNKSGLKIVLESDKVILSKSGVFVGQSYSCDEMFKLSINRVSMSTYMVDSSYSLWHGRLGHVSIKTFRFMFKHGLITFSDKEEKKCETCVQTKMIRLPFSKVERNTKLFELIHSDVCELNGFLTRGGNRYVVTFY